MKIHFVFLGRIRSSEIRALVDEYLSRIRHYAQVEVTELRETSATSLRKLKVEPSATNVLLDAEGKQFRSDEFAHWLANLRDRGTREIAFFCGGAEGFPEALRRRTNQKLALSTLTMPHELARVVLTEQVYRAFAILSGQPYPK
jgi:23S rRNA (pseudouridine1915-N3)-methyltransferase